MESEVESVAQADRKHPLGIFLALMSPLVPRVRAFPVAGPRLAKLVPLPGEGFPAIGATSPPQLPPSFSELWSSSSFSCLWQEWS